MRTMTGSRSIRQRGRMGSRLSRLLRDGAIEAGGKRIPVPENSARESGGL